MTTTGISAQSPTTAESPPPRRANPWVAMIAIALGVLIVSLDGTITAVANPILARDLGASLAGLQWITNIYLLAMAATLVLAGKLGDRFGRRTVFLTGIVGFAFASAAIACSPSVAMVIAGRLGQGLFGALIITNALALLRTLFPAEKLPKALSLFASLIGASSAAGPLVGGLLIEHTSWRWAFMINVPIALGSLAVGMLVLPRRHLADPTPFDLAGSILLAAALLPITFALIQAPDVGWTNWIVLALLLVGVIAGAAFIVAEKRAADPLIPMRLFADRSITLGVVLTIISFFSLVGSLFFVLLFLQQINGDSPMTAGLHILPLSIANVAASSCSGWIIAKYGSRPPLMVGMLSSAIGFIFFTGVDPHGSYLSLAIPFTVLGLGVGLVMTSSVQAVLGNAPIEDAGPAAGTHQTSLQIGGILGTAVLGAVMASSVAGKFGIAMAANGVPDSIADELSGDAARAVAQGVTPAPAQAAPDTVTALQAATEAAFMHGMHTTMWVGAGISLLGAVISIGVKRGRVVEGAPSVH
ncbi:DHA2 family efflux MFS transporter permease subunit [Rhodococcus koreensis]|uniref:DHA2 family efflux MFS transporter permease subunit n=1 Tax=Rhodococcus koreensis TaxID=99653 RepID=UPI0036DC3A7B